MTPYPLTYGKSHFMLILKVFLLREPLFGPKLVLLISDGNKPKHLESLKVALVAHFLGLNCLHQHLICFPHVHRKWSFLANSEASVCDRYFLGPKTSILLFSNEKRVKTCAKH